MYGEWAYAKHTIFYDALVARSVLWTATKLDSAGRLFAFRHCYQLAYASQQELARYGGVRKAQKIRMRLGGSASLAEPFPDKPKGMHWRTYNGWRGAHDIAVRRSDVALMRRKGGITRWHPP